MEVNFLSLFVNSACEVLSLEMREKVQRRNMVLESGSHMTDDVTVIISLIGSLNGTVFFSMSDEAAIQLASVLMGEKFEVLDKLAQSGIAELGNVITGRASMKFAESGCEADISTPALVIGKGVAISTLEYPRFVVPLDTSMGTITIHLALHDSVYMDAQVFLESDIQNL
jgi:chemotaxis protein CheX